MDSQVSIDIAFLRSVEFPKVSLGVRNLRENIQVSFETQCPRNKNCPNFSISHESAYGSIHTPLLDHGAVLCRRVYRFRDAPVSPCVCGISGICSQRVSRSSGVWFAIISILGICCMIFCSFLILKINFNVFKASVVFTP